MKRATTALLAGGAVFVGATAFAATLGVEGNNLGAGADSIAACDADGVAVEYDVDWVTDDYYVVGATVSGIDDTACAGEEIQLTLLDGATAFEADENGSATVDGATETFSFTTAPTAEQVDGATVTIYTP